MPYGGRENLEAVSFLREANATCYKRVPGIMMIAEESTAWPGVTKPAQQGGLGFGLKWNLGWMHDTLSYLSVDPVFRHYHQNEITFSMMYAFSENFVLPLSHDEVVHGKGSLLHKMPGDTWRQFAGLRALLAYQWAHPGKQLLFMGSEFGQDAEWSEQAGLAWPTAGDSRRLGVADLVRDLNQAYRDNPALWRRDFSPDGFSWIDAVRRGRQRPGLPALPRRGPRRGRSVGRRLPGQLLWRPARRLPGRAARRGPVARADQHRRGRVRRQRRGQPRSGQGRGRALARPARLGPADPAAARGALAGP